MARIQGIVLRVREDGKFGFIFVEDQQDIFFQFTKDVHSVGQRVEFETISTKEGLRAKDLLLLEPEDGDNIIHSGTVRFFNKPKNYGFIASGDEDGIFAHGVCVLDKDKGKLKERQEVTFKMMMGRRSLMAYGITRI